MGAVILGMMTACAVHQSNEAPPLTGPSTLAQSVSVTATPDLITQDGLSQSAIAVRVFDAYGQPMSAIPLRVDILVNGTLVDYGTLSTKSIVTGADGRATTVYTAPPAPPPSAQVSSTVTIRATALGGDAGASVPFSTAIRLVPPGVILPPADTPTPDFVVTPTPVSLNVAAIFDASASCGGAVTSGRCNDSSPIATYAWNFGDGSSGSGKTVSHRFVAIGTFNATLTVTNDRGLAASKTEAITVGASPEPAASFVFSPTMPKITTPVFFNADASRATPGRTIVRYSWNFGDGVSADGAFASHLFTLAGIYNVTLTVTDDVGQQGTLAAAVTVVP